MKVCRFGLLGLFVSCATILGGCGSRQPSVKGTVTLDGQPVSKGSILFTPVKARKGRSSGGIQNGAYWLKDSGALAPGTYRVKIRWPKPTGKTIPVPDDPPNVTDETEEAIPPKYNDKTILTVDISSGVNNLDFHLTSR